MTSSTGDRRLIEVVEEFLERRRRGELPTIDGYLARYPGLAAEVREVLSALSLVEDLKPRSDDGGGRTGGRALGLGGPPIERLGDFRILREVGRGGMGVVYEAEQESLGRRVALKVLAPWTRPGPRQVRRFRREARSVAQLHHTHIVPLFGVGEQDGLHYYAMQFIPGTGLDQVMEEVKRFRGYPSTTDSAPASEGPPHPGLCDLSVTEATRTLIAGMRPPVARVEGPDAAPAPGPSPPAAAGASPAASSGPSAVSSATGSDRQYVRRVARIGVQVAEALEYAHGRGILHRDVKPSNLLLDHQGHAWVTDFGLARAADDDALTRTGDLVGTLRYMAPERFDGVCDARSDLYSLGLTLYELLAGRAAFEESDRQALIGRITRSSPPPLRGLCPDVPRDLETIVHKAIERSPTNRYAGAGALAEDLRRFLDRRPIAARPVSSAERLLRWAGRNPAPASLGLVVIALLMAIAMVSAFAAFHLRQSRDGALLDRQRAQSAERRARGRLWEADLAQARANRWSGRAGRRVVALEALAEAARLDAYPDRRLDLRNEAIACMTLVDLREARRWVGLPPGTPGGDVGLDADFARYARCDGDGTISVRRVADDREIVRLPGSGPRAVFLRLSPDGRFVAAKHCEGAEILLTIWDLERGAMVHEEPDVAREEAMDFDPAGRRLAAGRRDGSIRLYDLATGCEAATLPSGPEPIAVRFDPEGRRLAIAGATAGEAVRVVDLQTSAAVATIPLPDAVHGLAWHPDGRRLVAGCADHQIYVIDASDPGGGPLAIRGHAAQVVSLDFDPRGDLLASGSWDGTVRLWDPRTWRELIGVPASRSVVRFSRDGRHLGPGREGAELWYWEVTPGREYRSLVAPAGSAAKATWSVDFDPAGRLLASAGHEGVRLDDVTTGRQVAALPIPRASAARFLPDGTGLLTSGEPGLQLWPIGPAPDTTGGLRVGPPRRLDSSPGPPTYRAALAPDGRTLAVALEWARGRAVVLDRLEPGRRHVALEGHPGLERIAISPDARWVATGTWNGTGVKVWDAREGRAVQSLDVVGSAGVGFSPDGRLLVAGSGQAYHVWEVGSWREIRRIPRQHASGQPGKLAFTRDGSLLAITPTRRQVRLIDPATGLEVATLEPPDPRHIADLGFSPDGGLLVVTSNTETIRVWDLRAIRRGLAAMGLDWDAPLLPPAPTAVDAEPLALRVEPAP